MPVSGLFWLSHAIGLAASIALIAWLQHTSPREATPEPGFLASRLLMPAALLAAKGPSLLGQFLYVRSRFWFRTGRATRAVLLALGPRQLLRVRPPA